MTMSDTSTAQRVVSQQPVVDEAPGQEIVASFCGETKSTQPNRDKFL
jgi:hypothetical protein